MLPPEELNDQTGFSLPEAQPILLVEDDDNDALLIERAFKRAGWVPPIVRMTNGEQAIAYLEKEGSDRDASAIEDPRLLLLDLKLPRKSGFEVLEWLARQPHFQRLLVVVLTSGGLTTDAQKAYDMGAKMFLIKSARFEGLADDLKKLQNYWLVHQQLPIGEL